MLTLWLHLCGSYKFRFSVAYTLAQAKHEQGGPADWAGSTIGVALITHRETLSLLLSDTGIVPEKWFAANCGVMTEALLLLLLIAIWAVDSVKGFCSLSLQNLGERRHPAMPATGVEG